VNFSFNLAMGMLYTFAATYAAKRPVPLGIRLTATEPTDLEEFRELCLKHSIIDLYLWLSLRFPKYFIEKSIALELKAAAIQTIERTLSKKTLRNTYSIRFAYSRFRTGKAGRLGSLPPIQFGEELQQATKANLAKIPHSALMVLQSDRPDPSKLGRVFRPHEIQNNRSSLLSSEPENEVINPSTTVVKDPVVVAATEGQSL
jgi:hypothetical protein